jgi:hypothetical protein
LLENQLHFFIIEELYNLAFPSRSNYHSFTELTCEYFEDLVKGLFLHQNKPPMTYQKKIEPPMYPYSTFKIMHFAELLRTFSLRQSQWLKKRNPDKKDNIHLYSASQLDEAGVEFKVGSRECVFNLKFTK